MRIALEVLFWIWSVGLALIALLGWALAEGSRGEANGAYPIGRGTALICLALLIVSMGLRVLW